MNGPAWNVGIVAAAILAAGPVRAQDFFGPDGATSYQPELDAYFRLAEGVRTQAQVQPYFVPARSWRRTSDPDLDQGTRAELSPEDVKKLEAAQRSNRASEQVTSGDRMAGSPP